ncbi:MAG: EamA family transporter [Spirochaetales bacterium]|nr:EamA family transporter [Spirochaetales bacterium]
MKSSSIFLFALTAAIGNALFAAGQKKAAGIDNSLLFVGLSAIVCIVLTFLVILIMQSNTNFGSIIKVNWIWILMSGFGLFLTYLGFNLLYTRFGATGYVYYAVLSIITTSLIVGVFIFKERLNIYHFASIGFSLIAIILFTLGNNASN